MDRTFFGSTRLAAWLHALRSYFGETIWRPVPGDRSLAWRTARRVARFLYLLIRGFRDDRVLVRAPALTLVTLLALVPLLALIVSLSQGFGMGQPAVGWLREILTEYLAVGQTEIVDGIIRYVEGTNFGTLGGVGLLFLVYAAISMLGTIEATFNDIWGVAHSRPLHRKITDYMAVIMIFPALLLIATGITASVRPNGLVQRLESVGIVSVLAPTVVKLLPLLALGIGLTFLYKFLPYTKVRLRAALFAGFFAGLAWHATQAIYIELQIGVTHNNVIYGTFAALPIFLIWLNTSWIIVLIGCEIAYAMAHESSYHPPVPHELVSIAEREQAALQVLAEVWKRFGEGAPPWAPGDLAAELDLPRPVTQEVLLSLVECGLLARATGDLLLPARDLSRLAIGEMLLAYRHARRGPFTLDPVLDERISAMHARLEQGLREAGTEAIGTVV